MIFKSLLIYRIRLVQGVVYWTDRQTKELLHYKVCSAAENPLKIPYFRSQGYYWYSLFDCWKYFLLCCQRYLKEWQLGKLLSLLFILLVFQL